MKQGIDSELIRKYNVQGPRYTSYPTVPFWKHDALAETDWLETIAYNQNEFQNQGVSVYIHLPYCESLCTFCGCHKRITRNHAVELPYLQTLLREWEYYRRLLKQDLPVQELHLGGGTPTFFSAAHLVDFLQTFFNAKSVDPEKHALSFEAHPVNTNKAHIEQLYAFGFRRLSLGIQSYSPTVQKAINRLQSFEQVHKVHNLARQTGYTSISHDLVYGLPKQTVGDMLDTIEKTLTLRPDRISLYSYAHVPWIKGNGQRGYSEADLPDAKSKRQLYELARELFLHDGYVEIGMDHFALETDELALAQTENRLHRNFMGYTTQQTPLLIGLGMSAISDSWYGFAQNEKTVERYMECVNSGKLPIARGHLLTKEEQIIRRSILELMCRFETRFHSELEQERSGIEHRLQELINDGLVDLKDNRVIVTQKGKPFVRNCCMAFDLDLARSAPKEPLFSKTI